VNPISIGLGIAWAVVLAWPIAGRSKRRAVSDRIRSHAARPTIRVRSRLGAAIGRAPVLRVGTRMLTERRRCRERRQLARELPVVTDLLGVAVSAGENPTNALALAARWAPPISAATLRRVGEARAHGAGFADALQIATSTEPCWSPIADALTATERLGAPIGANLARVSESQRAELRRAAEEHARRVPVRLLFPLVFLVLPAFGLLTVVPVLVSGLTVL
jgi:tight adherence protein C